MHKKSFLSVISFLASFGLAGQMAVAAPVKIPSLTPEILASLQPFYLHPRFNIWGFTGDSALVEGQYLMSLYGNQTRAFYVAMEGNYINNDNKWLAGGGLGYRQVVNNRIFGGYALADYFGASHNGFTVITPGLEMLGTVWDVNVKGYIPLYSRKKLGKEGWAGDDFGDYSRVRVTGHDLFDHRLEEYEEAGRGADAEIARVLPFFNNAKIHIGGYHFDTSDLGSINGVKARFTLDLNQYTGIEVEDSYDNNKHNQILAGVRFSLGGYSKEEKKRYGIATRLLDPISPRNRYLPLMQQRVDMGEAKEHDNIWFFKQLPQGVNGGANDIGPKSGSGTAEDPFIGFTPGNYQAINPNIGVIDKYPLMYFAPGKYNFNGFTSRGIDNRFNLQNGWGIYGRIDNYTAPAMGDVRPTFFGGLDMNYGLETSLNQTMANEPNTLNSIRINNNLGGKDNAALYVRNAGDVILQNTDIVNTFAANALALSVYGVYAENSVLNFAKLNKITDGANAITATIIENDLDQVYVYGIYADQNSIINFNGGNNSVVGSFIENGNNNSNKISIDIGDSSAIGIYADNATTINFNGGKNSITGTMATEDVEMSGSNIDISIKNAFGILADNLSAINFNGGENSVTGTMSKLNIIKSGSNAGTLNVDNVFGIFADNRSTINFNGGNNSIIGEMQGVNGRNINAPAINENNVFGIFSDNHANINFYDGDNSISGEMLAQNSNGTEANVFGIFSDNGTTINFNGGSNNITGEMSGQNLNDAEANVFGIFSDNNTNVNFNGGNNTITAAMSGQNLGTAKVLGIFADNATVINFNNSSDKGKVNIVATTSGNGERYGIYAKASSDGYYNTAFVKINGNEVRADTLNQLSNYVNFSGSGAVPGYAFQWGDLVLPW